MNFPPVITHINLKKGARVLVRASLNVPIRDGVITDTFRIEQSIRTIQHLVDQGARITVISHFGRSGESLAPVHKILNKHFPTSFIPYVHGKEVYSAIDNLEPGQVVLLENTRIDEREKDNVFSFVEELAYNQEIFVFDDFSAAHRDHASTTGLINFLPTYIGIRFYEELTALTRITERLVNPSIAFIGGAKVETKIPLIEKLLSQYDQIYVGGVTANVILQARGNNIGKSKTSDISVPESIINDPRVITPTSVLVSEDMKTSKEVGVSSVKDNDVIVDIAPSFISSLGPALENAKVIVWNGPLGWYEKDFFESSTKLAEIVGNTKAYSFLGGGDTVSAIKDKKILDNWTFVSTGGGSVLSYLANGTLTVLESLNNKI